MKGWLNPLVSLIVIILVMIPKSSDAQITDFHITDSLKMETLTEHFSVVTTDSLNAPGQIWNILKQNGGLEDIPFGFTQQIHWAGISLTNSAKHSSWMLEVDNPHINRIQFFITTSDSNGWVKLDETGRTTPFSTRRKAHFNFILPFDLEPGQSANLLVMLDKRRSSIQYQLKLWNSDQFNRAQQVHYASFGIYFGMFLLVMSGTLIAYLVSFKKVYLWYFLYVLSVGLFVFNDSGLAQQYIYPEATEFGAVARIFLTYVMLYIFISFTQHYFTVKTHYPKIHTGLNLFKYAVLIHAGIYYLFTGWFQTNATTMIILLYCLILSSIALAIYTAWLYLKVERSVSLLFITAFSFMFLAGIFFILTEFGILPHPDFLFTPVQVGSALEIIFLSAGLAWQVRIVENEQVSLRDRINRLQNEKLIAYIDGTEKERNRVAMDLHDSVGNRLGNLKRVIESGNTRDEDLQEELKEVINDVRLMSHKLAPPSMGLTGIEQVLTQLVSETDKKSSLNYSFQSMDVPGNISEEMKIQIYRIVQEAIQNIEKHSHANFADIQLTGHENQLVLTIEDDGVGMSTEGYSSNGIGIDNIKKRVNYFSGHFELTSQKQRGVLMFITLPLQSQ